MAILGIAVNPDKDALGVFLQTSEGRTFLDVDPRSWDGDGNLWYVDHHGEEIPVCFEAEFHKPIELDMALVEANAKDRHEKIKEAKKVFIENPRWTTYWVPKDSSPLNEEEAYEVSLWGYTHDFGQEKPQEPTFEEILKDEESKEYRKLNPELRLKQRTLVGAEEYLAQQGIICPEPIIDLVIDIDW